MKILEKSKARVYRFRCYYCRSKIEMTEEEKVENDWKFDESCLNRTMTREERESKGFGPHNPLDRFDCPVCKRISLVRRSEMHRFTIMENGNEIMDY